MQKSARESAAGHLVQQDYRAAFSRELEGSSEMRHQPKNGSVPLDPLVWS
jgi:hypothetical protein